jgi:hypothetical protein
MISKWFTPYRGATLLACCLCLAQPAVAQHDPAPSEPSGFVLHTEAEPGVETFAAHGQATYIWQGKSSFTSPYEGAHSLTGAQTRSYSSTVTADLGWRLGKGTEFHVNGEGAAGIPFSELHGLGGMTNGELAKTAGSDMQFYVARAFMRQTWGLGGGSERVEADMNQLAGFQDKRRVVLTVGTISPLDIFDSVSISHDPRTQFLNWSFLTHGSYDYAADARGYTWGGTIEYIDDGWAARFGRYAVPGASNGLGLTSSILNQYGDQLELEKSYSAWGKQGTARLLMFRNQEVMGSFDEAIAYAAMHGGTPDVANVRREQTKMGMGLSFDQTLTDSISAFMRINFADGKTETYSFTEIDRSVSGGVAISGDSWGRGQDTVGIAMSINALSAAHRQYLQLGGLGAFLGDGTLNYGTERVYEAYYSWRPVRNLWISADAQFIQNPGYNRDRGPATVVGVRLHTEF